MKKRAFTLIEVMVVIAIIGLLLAIAIPSFRQIKKQHEESLKAQLEKPISPEEKKDQEAMQKRLETDRNLRRVRSFGNGVYYFPFTENEFRTVISEFLSTHTNLEVTAVSDDVVKRNYYNEGCNPDSDYGITEGHTVFFKEKR